MIVCPYIYISDANKTMVLITMEFIGDLQSTCCFDYTEPRIKHPVDP